MRAAADSDSAWARARSSRADGERVIGGLRGLVGFGELVLGIGAGVGGFVAGGFGGGDGIEQGAALLGDRFGHRIERSQFLLHRLAAAFQFGDLLAGRLRGALPSGCAPRRARQGGRCALRRRG